MLNVSHQLRNGLKAQHHEL